MAFGVDHLEALAECVDLINSGRRVSETGAGGARAGGVARAGSETSDGDRHEQLASLDDVVAFGRRHRVENLGAARRSDVRRLRELRARLDAIAVACEGGELAAAIRGVNEVLADTGAVPQIVSHDGRPPHIHVTMASAPLADRIAAHSAMGLAELVVAGAGGRVRTCASPRCEAIFVDLSRNQTRRFCDSRTCGNRVHVAAYRSRRSTASP